MSQTSSLTPLRLQAWPRDEKSPQSQLTEAADALLRKVVGAASQFFAGLRRASSWESVRLDRKHSSQLTALCCALLSDTKPDKIRAELRHWMVAEEPEAFFLRQVEHFQNLPTQLEHELKRLEEGRYNDKELARDAMQHVLHIVREDGILREFIRFGLKNILRRDEIERLEDKPAQALPAPLASVAMDTLIAFLTQPPVRRWALGNVLRALQSGLAQDLSKPPVAPVKPNKPLSAANDKQEESAGSGQVDGEDRATESPAVTDPPKAVASPAEESASATRGCCTPASLFLLNGTTPKVRSRLIRLVNSPSDEASHLLYPFRPHEFACTEIVASEVFASSTDRFVCIRDGLAVQDLVFLEAAFFEYKRTPRALRRLEHSDPSRELWPPLIPSSLRIGCGRRDCAADISQLDRRDADQQNAARLHVEVALECERICPGCNKPILSRCGNVECLEEFLHLDADGKEHDCQACGRPNVNLYWRCPHHPDLGPFCTLEDPCCPECIRQWGWKARPRRPDRIGKGVLRCPGCLIERRSSPFLIPHRVRHLFLAQQPLSRERQVVKLCIAAGLAPEGRCPQCASQLIPFEEKHDCQDSSPTPRRPTLSCGYCEFPLDLTAEHCPRCRLAVAKCPVCELLPECNGRQAAGRPPASWFRRRGPSCECDRCGTRQRSLRHRLELEDLDGSVCSNIYGCPAGGLVAGTEVAVLLPPGCMLCPVCQDPDRPPIDIRAFLGDVRRCASCTAAMGDPRAWTTEFLGGPAALNGDLDTHIRKINAQQHTCRICGRGPKKPNGQEPALTGAALELSRFLWIGKHTEAARQLTRNNWRVLERHWPRPRRREAADLLIDQTDPRHLHDLSARLDALLASLDPQDTV